jgi:glycosyltransferase involved in cell wall biosynthesis
MKRFGSIFPFVEGGSQPRHIGRLVANHDFARALLKFASFDEFVFSNPSLTNLRMFADEARTWGVPDDRLARVRFVSYVGLPSLLASQPFHAFHLGGWGWFMAGLHYVRARYACNPWPITAVTHSLNGREVVDHAVRLSHAGMAPYDAVFCTSRDGREALRNLLAGGAAIAGRAFAGRLEHLPLGVDDDLLDARGDRERGRARLRIPADAVVLLVLGRMTPQRKMDLAPLLEAFARMIVPRATRPVHLLLAGSATPADLTLVNRTVTALAIADRVRVHANFPAAQKADVLAASDVLLSPVDNAQETFGLSLLEGAAASLPVVASHYDGYKDLVEEGVDGYLVDTVASPDDPMEEWFDLMDPDVAQLFQSQGVAVDLEQLADRILRLVHDDDRRAAMGRAGRAKVDRSYRWSRVIARYEECWDRLAVEAQHGGIVKPAQPQNPFNVPTARMFTHYASRVLGDDDRVVHAGICPDAAPYSETREVLQPEALQAIVAACDAPVRVGDLAKAGLLGRTARAGIVWLMKYGRLSRLRPPAQ